VIDSNGFDQPTNVAIRNRQRTPASLRQALQGLSVVYYLATDPGHVKIGTTSDIVARLGHLKSTWADVIAVEFGSFELERERHQQFSHLRVEGCERFKAEGDLLDHVTALRARLAA
jgi:hypothetical protein